MCLLEEKKPQQECLCHGEMFQPQLEVGEPRNARATAAECIRIGSEIQLSAQSPHILI